MNTPKGVVYHYMGPDLWTFFFLRLPSPVAWPSVIFFSFWSFILSLEMVDTPALYPPCHLLFRLFWYLWRPFPMVPMFYVLFCFFCLVFFSLLPPSWDLRSPKPTPWTSPSLSSLSWLRVSFSRSLTKVSDCVWFLCTVGRIIQE